MKKILNINAANNIKSERINEFDNSIYSETYQRAAEMVVQIIESNEEYRKWDKYGVERFTNENQISNVISFLGERGMGKSSVMLSFAYYLKTFYLNQYVENGKYKVMTNDTQGFYVLSKIDAAMIGTGENLLDIILAKMWDDYAVKTNGLQGDKRLGNAIRTKFSEVKSLYSDYQNFSKNNTKLEKNSDLSELHALSKSLNLRKKFAELVESYLENLNEVSKDNYLVICIDDLDIVKDGTYDILEQIRIFLSIPRVIIMITADIDRLMLDISSAFSEKLLYSHRIEDRHVELVNLYARDYLAKILPVNMRIYMPFFNATYSEVSLYQEKLFSLIYKDSNKVKNLVDEKRLIRDVIVKYTGIILYPENIAYTDEYKSLRNVVNGIDELKNIVEGENKENLIFQWMRKQVVIVNSEMNVSSSFKKFINGLLKTNESNYNYYILNYLLEYLNAEYIKEVIDDGDYGYGNILLHLGKVIHEKESIWMLFWLYSALIAKMAYDKRYKDIEQKIINNDIFLTAMRSNYSNTGWGCITNISPLMHLKLINEGTVEDIINEKTNAKQIVDSFNMLLFCDFDYIIELIKEKKCNSNSKTFVNDGHELSLSGIEKPNEVKQEILEITFDSISSKISMDNLIRNMIEYDKKWDAFWSVIVEIIKDNKNILTNKKIRVGNEINKLINLKEFSTWKHKYNVKKITDLLPIQSVGIMLEIEKALNDYIRINSTISKDSYDYCKTIIIYTLKRAEDEYDLDNLTCKNLKYSEKIKKLLEIVDVMKISDEKFENLPQGSKLIDPTME